MASTISSHGDRRREELELVARVGLGHFGIGRWPMIAATAHGNRSGPQPLVDPFYVRAWPAAVPIR